MEQSLKREQAKIRMQKMRNKKSVTSDSVTKDNVTQECNAKSAGGTPYIAVETVPASYVEGINGKMYEVLPERPRYLKLSDGQVLDRLHQPEGNKLGFVEMMRCNEASYNYTPSKKR